MAAKQTEMWVFFFPPIVSSFRKGTNVQTAVEALVKHLCGLTKSLYVRDKAARQMHNALKQWQQIDPSKDKRYSPRYVQVVF